MFKRVLQALFSPFASSKVSNSLPHKVPQRIVSDLGCSQAQTAVKPFQSLFRLRQINHHH